MFRNSYFRVALFTLMLAGALASGGAIKIWSNGDTLSAADLNSNFTHIHNQMVGGHGARLVNADVSATANIAYTKLENGRGIARAWAYAAATCGASPCVVAEQMNTASITRSGAGVYTMTLNYTATDAVFGVQVASNLSTVICSGAPATTTTLSIACVDAATAATPTDGRFTVTVFDED